MENVSDTNKARAEEIESFIEMSISEFSKMTGTQKAKALNGIIEGITGILIDSAKNSEMVFKENQMSLEGFAEVVNNLSPIIKIE